MSSGRCSVLRPRGPAARRRGVGPELRRASVQPLVPRTARRRPAPRSRRRCRSTPATAPGMRDDGLARPGWLPTPIGGDEQTVIGAIDRVPRARRAADGRRRRTSACARAGDRWPARRWRTKSPSWRSSTGAGRLQRAPRRKAGLEVRAQREAHERGVRQRLAAVSGDVADDDRELAVLEREHVVEVAACAGPGCGPVGGGGAHRTEPAGRTGSSAACSRPTSSSSSSRWRASRRARSATRREFAPSASASPASRPIRIQASVGTTSMILVTVVTSGDWAWRSREAGVAVRARLRLAWAAGARVATSPAVGASRLGANPPAAGPRLETPARRRLERRERPPVTVGFDSLRMRGGVVAVGVIAVGVTSAGAGGGAREGAVTVTGAVLAAEAPAARTGLGAGSTCLVGAGSTCLGSFTLACLPSSCAGRDAAGAVTASPVCVRLSLALGDRRVVSRPRGHLVAACSRGRSRDALSERTAPSADGRRSRLRPHRHVRRAAGRLACVAPAPARSPRPVRGRLACVALAPARSPRPVRGRLACVAPECWGWAERGLASPSPRAPRPSR